MIIVVRVGFGFGQNGTGGEMMTELIEKEGKEIGQIMKENWRNLSNFSLASNGVRQMDGQSISEVFFTKDKFYGFLPVWKWINM